MRRSSRNWRRYRPGFEYRPVTVRRDGDAAAARSSMGEFVSGNYFRTFGLRPEAGRLMTDADDTTGAPMTAVMSYTTWQREYNGDPAVVGSTFWVNTKAVTITGIAPAGFYGDRLSSTPPDFYLPIESMAALANAPYVHDADVQWLYMVGRVKPGVSLPALQQKLSALLRQSFAQTKTFSAGDGKKQLAKAHVVLTPARGGVEAGANGGVQGEYGSNLTLLMIDLRAGAADCVREHRKPAAGARHGTEGGDVAAHGAGCDARRGSSGNC